MTSGGDGLLKGTLYRASSSREAAEASKASSRSSSAVASPEADPLYLLTSRPRQSASLAASVPSIGAHNLETTGWTFTRELWSG